MTFTYLAIRTEMPVTNGGAVPAQAIVHRYVYDRAVDYGRYLVDKRDQREPEGMAWLRTAATVMIMLS